jgi:hypothetical protein
MKLIKNDLKLLVEIFFFITISIPVWLAFTIANEIYWFTKRLRNNKIH